MSEIQRQHEHYKDVRTRLWGKNKAAVNLYIEEQRRIAAYRREQQAKWEREQEAAAKADKEAQEISRRVKDFTAPTFILTGSATARFADQPDSPVGSVIPVGTYRRTMSQIALATLNNHPGISLDDVRGVSRKTPVMLARRHVIASIRIFRPDLSLPAIGRFMNKDHTTCLHAVRKFAIDKIEGSRSV